jgi:hypothetical protein
MTLDSRAVAPVDPQVTANRASLLYLGIGVGLNKLIAARKAPPAFRPGRLWRWQRSIVFAWVHDREAESTA